MYLIILDANNRKIVSNTENICTQKYWRSVYSIMPYPSDMLRSLGRTFPRKYALKL